MTFEIAPEDIETHLRLVNDYPFYARHIQKIEPKDLAEQDEEVLAQYDALHGEDSVAGMIPLIFHPGQVRLLQFVEDQMRERGFARSALVKPRQVGWSTAIQGRGNWRATKTPGMKIHIVSHNNDSTRKFLRRARKMCLAAPKFITPGRPVDNSKELVFDNGASYSIATAGSPDAVRSDSCHFLHASEEAFWKDAIANTGAIIPALSDGPGSEGYRESTSKGKNTPWHQFIQECIAGENLWRVFFDPWFAHPKYRMTPPPGWQPNDEALEAQELYNLDMAQLYWRAMKIKDLRALWMFKQEYPGTIEESFQASEDTLYNPDAIHRARKNHLKIGIDSFAPLILGVDPARRGDRTVLAFRQGKVVREVIVKDRMDDMQLVGIIANFLQKGFHGTPITKCFIDYAIGEGITSRLHELGFQREVQSVHFGESSSEPRYSNKRTEMFMDMRDWFGEDGQFVSIPDRDDIAADLLAIPDFLQGLNDVIKLQPKDVIKKDLKRSPDIADAIALTFAYPVRSERIAELHQLARVEMAHLQKGELASMMSDFDK